MATSRQLLGGITMVIPTNDSNCTRLEIQGNFLEYPTDTPRPSYEKDARAFRALGFRILNLEEKVGMAQLFP
jgi:hypothetical protein